MLSLSSTSSAFRPYFRPVVDVSPTEKFAPLSIISDLYTPVTSLTTPTMLPATLPEKTSPGLPCSNGKAKRKRTTFTSSQATILEKEYEQDQYMPRSRRLAVAESLSLSENQIKTWFQNRRAKDKKTRCLANSINAAIGGLPSASGPIPSGYSVPASYAPTVSPTTVSPSPATNVANSTASHSPCPSSTCSSATPPLSFSIPSSLAAPPPPPTLLPPPPFDPATVIVPQTLLELLALGKGQDLLSYGLLNEQILHSLAALQNAQSN